jgi:hypothetical protein
MKITFESDKKSQLENLLKEKEEMLAENTKNVGSFQKEINKLLNKQQELEYALLQTCGERDKQAKLIDELTKKYIFLENEKNEIEHLVISVQNYLFFFIILLN